MDEGALERSTPVMDRDAYATTASSSSVMTHVAAVFPRRFCPA